MTEVTGPRKHSGKLRLPPTRRRRRAGQRAGLTKDQVIKAATRLFEGEKGSSLSLRALAKALGVVPTTIKSHFKGGMPAITVEIARAAIGGIARPYKPRESPLEYLGDVFTGVLERLRGRAMVARLVVIELSNDPLVDPYLAERILLCLRELGAPPEYLHRGLGRVIGGLSNMILSEFAQSDRARQKALAEHLKQRIAGLEASEFPMLTGNAEIIVARTGKPADSPSSTVALKYLSRTVDLVQAEICGASLRQKA